MKNKLYLECTSGISGDMTVAALLDLGADQKKLERALKSLPVKGFDIKISRVVKSGIDACDFDVLLDQEHENYDHDMEYLHGHSHSHAHEEHHHQHSHEALEAHEHTHSHEHHVHTETVHSHHGHHHHEHRGLNEIMEIIDHADMTDRARSYAKKIFTILAHAEAKAHNVPEDMVHFHEVGAVDSIVDILSVAICMDDLDVEEVIVPRLCEGSCFFMRGPYGNGFEKENYQGKELIVVAGGTGVSPVRGVISYFGEHPDEVKKLHTILGFKSPSDILFREDLKIWEQQMELILTVDSADDDSYRTGLVTKYIPELELDNIHETAAIVVGPPVMMKFAVAELLKLGMKEEQIWISQERKMCCGLGKCGHCRMNDTYICLDGPVFCYSEGKKLFD